MAAATAFQPLGETYHISVTATPTATPFQVPQATQGNLQTLRVVVFNATGGTEVHMAWGQTAAMATLIAGAGGDPAAGSSIGGGGYLPFIGPSSVETITLPSGAYLAVWCAVAGQTADMYITPGEGV